ncbi:uncharacterized protein LOC129908590 isoform X2 [Episyrphus balteatus]|nr:uncharacterized protein LOC129908590 isoform X2 [Episyrphus balteatus]
MSSVQSDQPILLPMEVCTEKDQYIIFELKSDTDSTPTYSYVITNSKEEPPPDCPITAAENEDTISDQIVSNSVTEVIANPGPYIISVEIPVEESLETENTDICKENSPKTKRALARKRLAEAVDAVVNNDMTIGKAAKAFEVTKSTLWKEVNKHTNHRKKKVDKDLNKKIINRICAGESLSEISRSLNVAKSTIHLHKVRLSQSGQLPPSVTFKPPTDKMEQLAIKDRIIQAFRGIRVNGMSMCFASKFFSVPRSTLWKHIRRFEASQKKLAQNVQNTCQDTDISSEETSQDGSSQQDVDDPPENEDSAEESENIYEEQQSTRSEGVNQDDFDLLDAYCEQQANSDEGDFFISFDFETFEEYVKRELE